MDTTTDKTGRNPLLMVYGFAVFPTPLTLARRVYIKAGLETYTMAFSISNMRCVEAYAKSITAKAHLVRRKHKGRDGKIDIIGFSMGGVATLYALKRLGLAPYVDRFIAVAAPFHGADLAHLGFPSIMFAKAGRQLKPSSRFLRTLKRDPLPPGPEYIALSGEKDRLCPPDRTELKGADNILLPFRHVDFLFSSRLHGKILELLS